MCSSDPEPCEEAALSEYDPAAFGLALLDLDFVPDNAVDAVVATLCERSAAEAEELEVQRRQQEEVNAVLLDKGIAASLQEPVYIGSSDEE